ncbi:MFS transporter [Polyangium aurulentum]|uniref:MFS transporter n=1 Tax=Polyangium aurulentum TaxID=2567896 RepID=UPI00146A96C7|nr:MFS transporter [Polyangium aurulentum]UQA62532.1 MFS transporter [Polyangium aurulentum]
MLSLLRRRPAFRRLWLAATVSLIGDWLGFVAVSLLALDQGGGALALALVYAAHSVPHALLTPVGGVLVDRLDRRRLLIAVPLVQALLTVGMALAAVRGAIGLVQALVLVRTAGTAFMLPAEAAALRHTVEPEELMRANAIISGTWSVTFVAGMALGGALAVLGPVPAIIVDAFSFLLAAALLWSLPPMRAVQEEGASRVGLGRLLAAIPGDSWKALVHALEHGPIMRAVFSKTPVAVASGAGWVVLNMVANEAKPFGSAAISLGVLQAVRGAGTGLGPFGVSFLPSEGRAAKVVPYVIILVAFTGISLFPLAQGAPALLLLLALLWGIGTGTNWVMSSAALQQKAPDSMIGRLASLDDLGATSAIVTGALVGGALLEHGAASKLAVAAGSSLIGLFGWLVLVRVSSRRGEGYAVAESVVD